MPLPLNRRVGEPRHKMGLNILEMIRKYGRRVSFQDERTIHSIILGNSGQQNNPNISPPSGGGNETTTVISYDQTPLPIASIGDSGVDIRLSRGDHVHEGLHSISKFGSPLITGDATLTGTGGIELTQSGNNIAIDASSVAGTGGASFTRIVEYKTFSLAESQIFSLQQVPTGDVNVSLNGLRKYKSVHYTQSGSQITFLGDPWLDGEQAIFEYFTSIAPLNRKVEYFTMSVSSSIQVPLLYIPVGDPAVHLNGLRKYKGLHWTVIGNLVDFSPMLTSFLDSELVIVEYWMQPGDS
jgi:hypothetical protein